MSGVFLHWSRYVKSSFYLGFPRVGLACDFPLTHSRFAPVSLSYCAYWERVRVLLRDKTISRRSGDCAPLLMVGLFGIH